MVSRGFRTFLEELAPHAVGLTSDLPSDWRAAALEILPPNAEPQSGSGGSSISSNLNSENGRMRFLVAAPLPRLERERSVLSSLEHIENVLHPEPENWVRWGLRSPFQVLRLSQLEARILHARFPNLLLQFERKYIPIPLRHPLLERFRSLAVPASSSTTLKIRVLGAAGQPLEGVEVHLFTADDGGYRARSDASGTAALTLPSSLESARLLVLEPPSGYWSKVLPNPRLGDQSVTLKALEPEGFGWGQRRMGASDIQPGQGQGVKVGVVDSGIALHPALEVAGGQSFVQGHDSSQWADEDGHGTHCAGIIAGQWLPGSTWGHAPDCELHALRVFGLPGEGGYTSDIADALDYALEGNFDLLNLSLGMSGEDAYLSGKFVECARAGMVCVAAAGNEATGVSFPARHPQAVAVSALGQLGTYPPDSLSGQFSQSDLSSPLEPSLYLARFSNRGPELRAAAPGVAVISTVLNGGYASMDGTSMACPQVTGWLAALLSQRPDVLGSERTLERHTQILAALRDSCVTLGLGRDLEGWGIPKWKEGNL